jgi:hypothetical protein
MWCMNIVYAKSMQVFSSLFYVGLIIIFLSFADVSISTVIKIICICGAILWGIAIICLFSMNKEKVVLNLQD